MARLEPNPKLFFMPHKKRKTVRASNSNTARYIQFLRVAPNGKVTKAVVGNAPDPVIKAISNAALNAAKGQVRIGPKERQVFTRHRPLFSKLISRTATLASKRKALVNQRGGAFPLIPLLIGAVIASLGTTFLSGKAHDIGK